MVVNGKELDFRIGNLRHAAAYEKALIQMGETEDKIKNMKEEKLTPVLKAMIDMFRQFFLEATGVDVLADCEDMQEAREAYEQFLGEIVKQKKAMLAPYSAERIK